MPPPERARHGQKIVPFTATDRAGVYASRVEGECLLDRLLAAGRFGPADVAQRRYFAGVWLRQKFIDMGMGQPVAMSWVPRSSGSGDDFPDHVERAFTDYQGALAYVAPAARQIVVDVSCYDFEPEVTVAALRRAFDMLASAPFIEYAAD